MDRQPIELQEVHFSERTDAFELSARLMEQQRLTVTMKDLVDWIIYSKEYTKEDIGKQIHQKMDIIDVYAAFAQTKPQCDEERMKEKQHQGQLNKYQFGTIVNSSHYKLPCYKIDTRGRITTYLIIVDKITGKDVTYESKMVLNQIRKMDESEISTEKSIIKKNQMLEELKEEIQKEKNEKEEQVKRVNKLEEDNRRLNKELRIKREELKVKDEKLGIFEIRIINLAQELTALDHKLKQKRKYSANQQLANLNKAEFDIGGNKGRKDQNERKIVISYAIENLMTLPQAYRNQFKVDGFKVTYKNCNQNCTQFIFNCSIHHNQAVSFRIRIIKTQNRNIMIGMVDYARQRDDKYSHDSDNAMCYHGFYGAKFPQHVFEGDGFKQGDVVEVDVSRSTSTIRYRVNGVHQATHCNSMLADNSRVFMPFVELYNANDQVEWLW